MAKVRRIIRSSVPCNIGMGFFFTWYPSRRLLHLNVKWKLRDEVPGAGQRIRLGRGPILLAVGGLIQTRFLPFNVLIHSGMPWKHAADLTMRDKRDMGVTEVAEDSADSCASKLLKRRSRTGSRPDRYSIRTPYSHPVMKARIRGG
jgi:hypothetical protein